ncbi:hypothetical protein [Mycobacterium paraense]|uniref:hypothetical protein n=1 Tax=Mycobacterium paraense TaxID=767916 RepID=UPI00111C74E6|nr:hypothetical protein [Mycobacterium paraense]
MTLVLSFKLTDGGRLVLCDGNVMDLDDATGKRTHHQGDNRKVLIPASNWVVGATGKVDNLGKWKDLEDDLKDYFSRNRIDTLAPHIEEIQRLLRSRIGCDASNELLVIGGPHSEVCRVRAVPEGFVPDVATCVMLDSLATVSFIGCSDPSLDALVVEHQASPLTPDAALCAARQAFAKVNESNQAIGGKIQAWIVRNDGIDDLGVIDHLPYEEPPDTHT